MHNTITDHLADLQPIIYTCMQDGHIPGLAVGIVAGNDAMMQGFGYRDLERQLPVTAHSRFGIQSCTKAFTAAVAGMLVDRGELAWDRPICEYVPTFRMFDLVATAQATMRDLLSHRTGMPFGGHDWLRVATSVPNQEYLERLPYLEPSQPFRSAFQYSNLMYIVAGAVMEQVAGMTWEAMVRQWIFTPLAMQESGFSSEVEPTSDVLTDYVETSKGWSPTDAGYSLKIRDTLNGADGGPCGSICASVSDMCRWLQVQLGVSAVSLFSPLARHELQNTHIPCPSILREAEVEDDGYAMGWFTQWYRGHRLLAHWGGASGPTIASFMPDTGIGVVVHSSRATSSFHAINAIALSSYDLLLGLEIIPWHVRWREAIFAPFLPPDPPGDSGIPVTDDDLPGAYHHSGYGTIRIEKTPRGCVAHYGALTFRLTQHDECTIAMTLIGNVPQVLRDWWGTRLATLLIDTKANVIAITIPFELAVSAVVFSKMG